MSDEGNRPDDGNIPASAELGQLEARIAKLEARANDHEKRGGANREAALVIIVSSAVALFASVMLVVSEFKYLRNPANPLLCDVNPLVGCSTWFDMWQGHLLLGIPNAVFGVAFFSGMLAFGLVLGWGGTLARALWRMITIGVALGAVWVLWFAYQSYVVERSLCPYCLLVWLAFMALAIHVLARALQAGHWGDGAQRLGRAMVRSRWLILGLSYALLAAFTLIWFWDTWVTLF